MAERNLGEGNGVADMRPVRIDCAKDDWGNILQDALQDGREAELVNFDYHTDGQLCATLTISHSMHVVLDPKSRTGFFKKQV